MALGSTVGLVGLLTQLTTGQAAYRWVKTKNYNGSHAYHQKNKKTSAYMWNASRTKKLHNLKNYPKTTWYLNKSVKMSNGKKSAIYYKVTSSNKKVNGYVWRGFLSSGTNPTVVADREKKTTILRDYSYPEKNILYSRLPFANNYDDALVRDYDPQTASPALGYKTQSTAELIAANPSLTNSEVRTIIAYLKQTEPNETAFRITNMPVFTSDGQTVIPVVQTLTKPSLILSDVVSSGYWGNNILAATVLKQVQAQK